MRATSVRFPIATDRRFGGIGRKQWLTVSSVLRRVEACQPTLRTGMGGGPQSSAPAIRNVQGSTSLAAVSTVAPIYNRFNKKKPASRSQRARGYRTQPVNQYRPPDATSSIGSNSACFFQ